MNKTVLSLILLLMIVCTPGVQAQVYNEMDASGNINQYDERGNQNFNPNKRDSVKSNKEFPKGVWAWKVDRLFGDIQPSELDTMPHLYQNSIYNTGLYGEYNTTGNNYTPRLSRIFINRSLTDEFFFTQPYDYTTKQPDDFLFLNTLSPYTNISYDHCGDQQHGEDHIDAKFAVNANKRLGFGFDLDYYYGMGYYQAQSNANFRATLFGSYRGDRYQMHLMESLYHRKQTENGGIMNDNLITHPELETVQFSEDEIPTVLTSNWNRNDSKHLFFSHRYNIGFYRKVPMTEEEIKARKFAMESEKEKEQAKQKDKKEPTFAGRPKDAAIVGAEPPRDSTAIDTTRIKVDSQEMLDSLLLAEKQKQAEEDSTMKKEFVPVTSIIHTLEMNKYDRIYQSYGSPDDYYANTYFKKDYTGKKDSLYDQTRHFQMKNTLALALLEGFNKWAKAGLKVFATHEVRNFEMDELQEELSADADVVHHKVTEHNISIGGQLIKSQGHTLHYNAMAELWAVGEDAGQLKADFNTDLNFPLFGDTVTLAAHAHFYRLNPTYYQRHYHSKHFWWDNDDLSKETHTRIEGTFSYQQPQTSLRVAIEEIQNYTYLGMIYMKDGENRKYFSADINQHSSNINMLTAQLRQHLRLGPVNWENVVTYQNSSDKEVLPVPALNLFTNLYLGFKIARVLSVELGACCTFFTEYEAPDFCPQLNQYAVQEISDSRVTLGNYPFVDVYANMHLKRARFFIMWNNIAGNVASKNAFLTPYYPINRSVMHLGVSWNFFN